MKCAIKEGISVLRILQEDVWVADDAWLDEKLKPHLAAAAGDAKYTFIVEPKDESIYNEHVQLLATDAMPDLESDDDSDTTPPNELCH